MSGNLNQCAGVRLACQGLQDKVDALLLAIKQGRVALVSAEGAQHEANYLLNDLRVSNAAARTTLHWHDLRAAQGSAAFTTEFRAGQPHATAPNHATA